MTPAPIFSGPSLAVIGDVHGRADLLGALLDALGNRPVLFLGDLVDRGPDSAGALAMASAAMAERPGSIALLGNHENMMARALRGEDEQMALWLPQGGAETLRSFGVELRIGADASDFAAIREAMAAHGDMLDEIGARPRFAWGEGAARGLAFAHAGVDPLAPLSDQDAHDLIWIRKPFLDWPHPLERRIVHGHTIEGRRPRTAPHRIGLDTGVFSTGVLCAMVLEEGAAPRFVAARGPDTTARGPDTTARGPSPTASEADGIVVGPIAPVRIGRSNAS